MKTSFKQFLLETAMPLAVDAEDLFSSIADGKFTKDGSHLELSSFNCSLTHLTSLKGAPSTINGNFYCFRNQLKTLEGAPVSVSDDFNCSTNKLSSLKGAPAKVGGNFSCYENELTSLESIHTYIKEIERSAFFTANPIRSHVLGLLKIKKLKSVYFDNEQLEAIVNKYLPEGDIFACQQELIDAGLEAYAQL